MRVSIIVATYNRKSTLRRCLTALFNQDHPDCEIIVVDDASTDGTGDMMQAEFPHVRYLRQDQNRGPAAARNRGVTEATGEIIVFTDDDCLAPPDWLERHLAYYTDENVAAVAGPQIVQEPNLYEKFQMAHYLSEGWHTPEVIRHPPGSVTGREGLATSNLSVRQEVFGKVGCFDEAFLTGADPEFVYRVSRAGYTVIQDPTLQVEHLKVHTLRSFLNTYFRRSLGSLLSDLKQETLAFRRFIPIVNPIRSWRNWHNLNQLFDVNWQTALGYWTLALLTRWITVAGRLYHWMKVYAARTQNCPPNLSGSQRFLWRTGASPIKLRYLTQYASGSTALDIGSGHGFYTHHLRAQGFTVIALDTTLLLGDDILFVQGRLNALPFANHFDTVVCFDVLEHEEDEQQALNELKRLTRKRLLLSVPNADDSPLLPYNLTYKHHIDKTHVREYTYDRLRRLLEEAGFRIIVLRGEGPVRPAVFAEFIRPRWLRTPARLLIKALHRLHLLHNPALMADVYVVAEPN